MSTSPPTEQQNTNTSTELSKEVKFSLQDFLAMHTAQSEQRLLDAMKTIIKKEIAAVTPDHKSVANGIISNIDELCNIDELSALTPNTGIAPAPANSDGNHKSSDHHNDGSRAPSNLNLEFGVVDTVNNAATDAVPEVAVDVAAAANVAVAEEAAAKVAAAKEPGAEEAETKVAGSGGSVNKENISISSDTITSANRANVVAALKQKIALLEKAKEKAADKLKAVEQAITAEKPVIRYARSNKKMIAIGVISGLTNKWCHQQNLPEWCEGLREGKFIISISVYYDMLYI
jgi:hypothetical protein